MKAGRKEGGRLPILGRMSPRPGDPAPDFQARSERNDPIHLAALRGQWVVLFFFPRANTTHCQLQARRFEALMPEFRALGAQPIGVSSDSRTQLVTFHDVCRVSYPLVPDPEHVLSERYGVLDDAWPDSPVRPARRETFLISPEGQVVRHWTNVDPGTHAAEVLAEVQERVAANA